MGNGQFTAYSTPWTSNGRQVRNLINTTIWNVLQAGVQPNVVHTLADMGPNTGRVLDNKRYVKEEKGESVSKPKDQDH